ncbi:MAG: formylglycine-generating enzyme family protein [Chitinivibrionia bacterium]|nr:formylglycine-generating enzyme family protein [Chitinivibrionia bacterium]
MKALLLLIFCLATAAFSFSEIVQIRGGTFNRGSERGNPDERPVREITVDAFRLDKRPVSNNDYQQCVNAGRCSRPNTANCFLWTNQGLTRMTPPEELLAPNNPVICITWRQASEYCRFRGGRLPTEAEWEFAATNGGRTTFSWGNERPTPQRARFRSRSSVQVYTFDGVGDFGLVDMNGNVWEWVNDRYEQDFYQFAPQHNPRGPQVGRFNVIRGGGWYSEERALRGTNRQWFAPEAGEISIGVRCAH